MTDKGNRERRREICKKTKKCDRCPMHGGENRGRRPRTDKGKNHRGKS